MWATISLGLLLLLLSFLPWPASLLGLLGYFVYSPRKWHALREYHAGFRWLRESHCSLSYAGRVDILREERARIFVFHPHGMHCIGAVLLASDPSLTHLRIACSSFLFWVPIVREFCAWGNAFACSRKAIEQCLASNSSVVLYPGGMNEIPAARFLSPNDLHLERRGFLRIAMEQEIDVVPCWVAGETELYTVYHPWPALQQFCYRFFRYPWPVISLGWHWLPCLPKSRPLIVHVGEPIVVRRDGNLEEYHEQYRKAILELQQLYRPS